jgi:hypothetical protein
MPKIKCIDVLVHRLDKHARAQSVGNHRNMTMLRGLKNQLIKLLSRFLPFKQHLKIIDNFFSKTITVVNV